VVSASKSDARFRFRRAHNTWSKIATLSGLSGMTARRIVGEESHRGPIMPPSGRDDRSDVHRKPRRDERWWNKKLTRRVAFRTDVEVLE
jgi:hypothetical protein